MIGWQFEAILYLQMTNLPPTTLSSSIDFGHWPVDQSIMWNVFIYEKGDILTIIERLETVASSKLEYI